MPFTPVHSFVGAVLLHLSTSQLLEDTGRVFGISGIVNNAVLGEREGWRWAVVGGLVAGPALAAVTGVKALFPGQALSALETIGKGKLALAGILVGLGSCLSSGCTSGHMLCGVSRLSIRSIVATVTFFATATITGNIFPLYPIPSTPAYSVELPSFSATVALICIPLVARLIQRATNTALTRMSSVPKAARLLPYLVSSLIFSFGLSLSGMTDPSKVSAFLRFPHPQCWDPSLFVVVLGGVLPNMLHYSSVINKNKRLEDGQPKPKPRFSWESWQVPTRKDIDSKLVMGAAIFGVGWGLAGICPGPALVSLGSALLDVCSGSSSWQALGKVSTFLGTMLLGMVFGRSI
ncbi:hypothetical protein AYX15_05511 [Cryptococcus neoformans]|nr:hypothetical protein AYX15_05511 [Cryptococcus neoformans var. grubii]